MRIVAIDAAIRVGWAMTGPEAISFGAYQLPKDAGNPPRFIHFRRLVHKLIHDCAAEALVIEAPLPRKSLAQTELAFGFFVQAQVEAYVAGIRLLKAHNQTVKKFWTGNGRAEKQQMIHEAQRRGFKTEGSDEADAIAILHYAMATYG